MLSSIVNRDAWSNRKRQDVRICCKRKLSDYLIRIAMLGGYLACTSDPPPGNIVMWRGLTRLTDIALGFKLGIKMVGN